MSVVEARLVAPDALPRFKRDQHRRLEDQFRECRNPTDTDMMLIAAEVGVDEYECKVG